mmetsp:Transcript_28974/g.68258  ORF Transcript_28974/g.68258 Transcript_28974/m.68258 type:complete len:266 (-) Transcript_28974:597-1394(-)
MKLCASSRSGWHLLGGCGQRHRMPWRRLECWSCSFLSCQLGRLLPDILVDQLPLILHVAHLLGLLLAFLFRVILAGGIGLSIAVCTPHFPLALQAMLGVLARVVLEIFGILLLPPVDLPLHSLFSRHHWVSGIRELILNSHGISFSLLPANVFDHLLKCLHVALMLRIFFLLDSATLGPFLLQASAIECICSSPVLRKDWPVIKVLQVLAHCSDALAIVRNLLCTRIALEVQNAQVSHARENLRQNVWVPNLVVLKIQRRDGRVH